MRYACVHILHPFSDKPCARIKTQRMVLRTEFNFLEATLARSV